MDKAMMPFKTHKRWVAALLGVLALLMSAGPGWCPNPVQIRRLLIGGIPSGKAAGFSAASSQYLRMPSAPPFVASGPIAIAGWVYVTNLASSNKQRIISKEANASGSGDEWMLRTNPAAGGGIEWVYGYGVSSEESLFSQGPVGISSNTWIFVYADLNPGSTNTMVLSVNDQTLTYSNFHTDVIHQSTNPVTLGADANADAATLFDGRIDALGVWNRQLTQTEVNTLYNSGLGLRFSTLPSSLKTSLVTWWDMDTPAWVDSSGGGYTLTPHNGVSLVAGKT